MPLTSPSLDLAADVVTLTAAICDIESVSGGEGPLADAIEAALGGLAHLEVVRDGHTVIARTALGRPERVVVAGHIDTVPLTRHTPNLPTRRVGDELVGRGTVDMKGGVAVMLKLAAAPSGSGSGGAACSARSPAWASRSATIVSSRPASMSPRAPR